MCGQLTGLVPVQSHLAHVPEPDSLAFPFLQKHGYVFLGPYRLCEAVIVKKKKILQRSALEIPSVSHRTLISKQSYTVI